MRCIDFLNDLPFNYCLILFIYCSYQLLFFFYRCLGTTTTAFSCGQSCLNQSWTNPSGVLALWPFDGSYNDNTTVYDGYISVNLPSFVTGYFGQAASFNTTAKQAMYTQYIPLANVSFSVEAWIQPTGYPNTDNDHNIVGLCTNSSGNLCLQILIRNKKLYFGFYGDDCTGVTNISLNQWIHVAFVFDVTIKLQTIYLNGFLYGNHTANNALSTLPRNFTIGTNALIGYPNSFFQVRLKIIIYSLLEKRVNS
jgi:hypothetical protein